RGEHFHFYFLVTGLLASAGTILNASLVVKIGMRRLAIAAFGGQAVLSLVLLLGTLTGLMPQALDFPLFFFWSFTLFAMAGLTLGNLNALALQPLGHIAGMASSTVGAISTVAAVPIAIATGLAFNGTTIPMMLACVVCSGIAFFLMRLSRDIDPTPKTSVSPAD
ncbi:MAG: multidrug MFS transporter, partial [Rhodobacteraceae bacterium]|nr:multidrug MFS transporter [Paracoccaceae bacterium]